MTAMKVIAHSIKQWKDADFTSKLFNIAVYCV